jgi:hypothetical protein
MISWQVMSTIRRQDSLTDVALQAAVAQQDNSQKFFPDKGWKPLRRIDWKSMPLVEQARPATERRTHAHYGAHSTMGWYPDVVERRNSEGILPNQLKWTLTQPHLVLTARKMNACLMCRRTGVNEAGLCDVCYVLLDDPEEQRLATRWMTGVGP